MIHHTTTTNKKYRDLHEMQWCWLRNEHDKRDAWFLIRRGNSHQSSVSKTPTLLGRTSTCGTWRRPIFRYWVFMTHQAVTTNTQTNLVSMNFRGSLFRFPSAAQRIHDSTKFWLGNHFSPWLPSNWHKLKGCSKTDPLPLISFWDSRVKDEGALQLLFHIWSLLLDRLSRDLRDLSVILIISISSYAIREMDFENSALWKCPRQQVLAKGVTTKPCQWIDFVERAPSGIFLLAWETQMEWKSRFLSRGTAATKATANV
jgi:hypothetical protein